MPSQGENYPGQEHHGEAHAGGQLTGSDVSPRKRSPRNGWKSRLSTLQRTPSDSSELKVVLGSQGKAPGRDVHPVLRQQKVQGWQSPATCSRLGGGLRGRKALKGAGAQLYRTLLAKHQTEGLRDKAISLPRCCDCQRLEANTSSASTASCPGHPSCHNHLLPQAPHCPASCSTQAKKKGSSPAPCHKPHRLLGLAGCQEERPGTRHHFP